jgi:hypothetical protein
MSTFRTSPWTNGSQNSRTGAGFGVRIPAEMRRVIFREDWSHVLLTFDGETIKVPITASFWRQCNELRSKRIGEWLIRHGHATWPKRSPPEILITHEGGNRFALSFPIDR